MVEQNNMQNPSTASRLTGVMFNQFACFGNESSTNEQISEIVSTPTEELIHHIFARHRLSVEQFIKLFIQNVLLSTYLSQDFPFLPIFSIDHPVKGIVEGMLEHICENNEIRPSTSRETTNKLVAMLESALGNLYILLQSGKNLSEVEQKEFIEACEHFLDHIRTHLQEAQNIFENVEDNAPLTKEMFNCCMPLFYTECVYGMQWVLQFFEYSNLKYVRINLSSYRGMKKGGITMQTQNTSEERYIECTLSPCLSLDEFIKVPIFIFHEYISHLSASIYCGAIQSKQQKKEVIESYEGISKKVNEGWMVHVAETFLHDKLYKILDVDRRHLQHDLKLCLGTWVSNIHSSFGGKVYIYEAAAGGNIAEKFLTLLRQDICNEDEGLAKLFYYRLSFDLITRYPSFDFKHLHFVDTITTLHQKHRAFLVKALLASINVEKQYIDIELLWQRIKDYRPKIDLKIPRIPL